MDIMTMLDQMGGIQSVARELGISESTARSGAEELLPAILGGLKREAQAAPNGLDGLGAVLGALGGGDLLDDVLAPRPTHVDRGNDVLGQIFGSREVSRTVAGNAASRSGIDPELLKRMLPMLAMLVAGYFSRQRNADTAPPQGNAEGGLGGLLGGVASMLDLDGDGNPLDDILRMADGVMSGSRH